MNMAGTKQHYWIDCSGSGYVFMDEDRLEALMECMPTLRFLLFGHPNMASKTLKKLQDGSILLTIDAAFAVSKESFILLINCIFEVEPIPPRSGAVVATRWRELVETMTVLGGCAVLESRLHDSITNPLTPEEDTNDDYTWCTIYQAAHLDVDKDVALQMYRNGFSLSTTRKDEDARQIYYYYRKSKKQG